jgi:DNA adenine methylase
MKQKGTKRTVAPFPWFGGKSRIAPLVWGRFGDVRNYIEPFFGSGAVLLNRPQPFEGVETINDADGLVCNFWRAVQHDPEAVAHHADWPVNENDLHARHMWLVERKDSLQARLEGNPDHYDAKTAGWWVWGMACWIGGEFCSGKGPWKIRKIDGARQLVHLSDAGRGVNRQLVHLSDAGRAGSGECGLLAWMQALADRLQRVRVCCGDWTRVCGGRSGDALTHFFASGRTCAVFLDPPYADTADRDSTIYRVESLSVAHAVRKWAIAHGDDKRLRIALCGYDGEHKMPDSWTCVGWKAQGGMSSVARENKKGRRNAYRECVWFSPHCLDGKMRRSCLLEKHEVRTTWEQAQRRSTNGSNRKAE